MLLGASDGWTALGLWDSSEAAVIRSGVGGGGGAGLDLRSFSSFFQMDVGWASFAGGVAFGAPLGLRRRISFFQIDLSSATIRPRPVSERAGQPERCRRSAGSA